MCSSARPTPPLELEEVLAAEGHDPADAMTVDGVITDATGSAVEALAGSYRATGERS